MNKNKLVTTSSGSQNSNIALMIDVSGSMFDGDGCSLFYNTRSKDGLYYTTRTDCIPNCIDEALYPFEITNPEDGSTYWSIAQNLIRGSEAIITVNGVSKTIKAQLPADNIFMFSNSLYNYADLLKSSNLMEFVYGARGGTKYVRNLKAVKELGFDKIIFITDGGPDEGSSWINMDVDKKLYREGEIANTVNGLTIHPIFLAPSRSTNVGVMHDWFDVLKTYNSPGQSGRVYCEALVLNAIAYATGGTYTTLEKAAKDGSVKNIASESANFIKSVETKILLAFDSLQRQNRPTLTF
jgi:hypothetical protein